MARSLASSLGKVKSGCGCVGMHDKDCCNNPSYRKSGFSAANEDSIYTGGIPDLQTAEDSYTQEDRQNLSALASHLYKNNGAAHGLVEMTVEHLAASWTPNPTPIKKLLPDWDDEDFDEWSSAQICFHRDYLDGTKYISASEDKNFTGLVQQQVRLTEILGEVTATVEYLDPRTAQHRHREMGTAINVFEPNRIYNPLNYQAPQNANSPRVIDGIKKNRYGKTLGAYIHNRPWEDCSLASVFDIGKAPPLTPMYGVDELAHRQRFIHCFADKELGYCRGVTSFAASAEYLIMQWQTLRNITMLAQRQNETTGVFSSKDPNMTAEKLGPRLGLPGGSEGASGVEWEKDPHLSKYKDCSPSVKRLIQNTQHLKATKALDKGNTIGDMILPEGVSYAQVAHNNNSLAATELFNGLDHSIAAAHSTGKSQLTKEYDGNYTAMRASRLDNAQSLLMKKNCTDDYANSIYRPAAEEAVEVGILPLPPNVVRRHGLNTPEKRHRYFVQNIRALTAMGWNKPQDRLIDPKKDAEGHAELYENGLTTKAKSVAEIHGISYDQFLDELYAEKKKEAAHKARCEKAEIEARKAEELPDADIGGNVADRMADIKAEADTYGVSVRAGTVTPQPQDEEQAREKLGLPPMSAEVRECWQEGGNVRLPITLKSKEQLDTEQEILDETVDETEEEQETETEDA